MATRKHKSTEKSDSVINLNACLVLNKYFLSLFGKTEFKDLAEDMKSVELEGYNEENTSFFHELIIRKYVKLGFLNREKLKEYDENIFRYVRHIGENRGGLTLKYFQYLSLLFTEIYLDRYFLDRDNFVRDFNEYLTAFNANNAGDDIGEYTLDGLNKLAYMCATGSGKTLIMHANILQFQHYFEKANEYNSGTTFNKIILLTPNEGLSNQHIEEMKLSNIKCSLFEKGTLYEKKEVLVIDINKLAEQGIDKTVSVDSFEQNNLVLVDEGHKGLSGNVWYDFRSRLSAEGFSFEYSATFKQAIKDEKKKSDAETLAHQYGKAIIFDYSYKYFYGDGYGKDYRIYNLKDSISKEQQEIYLTGCLLSYYQQMKVYNTHKADLIPFNIEAPLLVFVGNSVNKSVSKVELTDVQEVLAFINRFSLNRDVAGANIKLLLEENTGLLNANGQELFFGDFAFVQKIFNNAYSLYEDVLKIIFGSPYSGKLHMVNLKQLPGEIALRIGSDNDFFGVINVGTGGDNDLIKNIEKGKTGIITENNQFEDESLFQKINEKNSKINILIGSKKFTEGWNSYRVSTMGLINFAKGEGSQAIQLFGRGVRLKGYENSLKRSTKLDFAVSLPDNIRTIETLTIFGVKADYMTQFKEYLEKEDMDLYDSIKEFKLPVVSRFADAKDKLKVIKVKEGIDYKKQARRLVVSIPSVAFMDSLVRNKIKLDYNATIQSITSEEYEKVAFKKEEVVLEVRHLAFLHMDKVYEDLLEYKNQKKYFNLTIEKSYLIEILKLKGWYTLLIPKAILEVNSFDKISRIRDIATMLLKNYLDRFFKYHKSEWEAPYLVYSDFKETDKNYIDEYSITLFNKERFDEFEDLFKGIKEALDKNKRLDTYQDSLLNFHYFDFHNHMYTPLISVDKGIRIEVTPVSLNNDEKFFVDRLKDYCDLNPSIFVDKRMYLLRNKSKVGMGFFEAGNFYPDYIMWIAENDKQYITFIDPKGIMMLDKNINNPKILFYKTIKDLETRLQPSCSDIEIILNSFIMSGTSAADAISFYGVKKVEFESKNVVFLEDNDCIEKMMAKVI